MRNELIELYQLACANANDKDIVRAYQRARDRIGPQIAVHEAMDADSLRARVARLEEALRFILDECDWEPTHHESGGDERIGAAAFRALEDK